MSRPRDATVDELPAAVAELERGIDEGLHLGGQLYVSLAGRPVADLALGEARPGVALTRGHLMLWLSSTKPVAAVAVARLWEAGLLDLDDPVARHLPEFGNRGKETITVRHLLTHTAGLRMLDPGWPRDSWDEIVARICAMKPEPRWAPGRQAGYHRASTWFLLGELVRRLDGRPFERYAREEIFAPLGMDDCWIGMPAQVYARERHRLAPLFDTVKRPPRELGWDTEPHVTRCHPGGNGYGPVRQLARLYECLLRGGRRAEGGPLLTPQTVAAMTARHRVRMMDRTFRRELDWGLGVILDSKREGAEPPPYGFGPDASPRTFGHSGYRSSAAFGDPEHRLAVALAVNGAPDDGRHLARFDRVFAAVYRELGLTAPEG
ncbi:MAG: serine hydrolase domain-containing protein [Thermoanaerobaculia bacterium]|nr:serine hydrolase domain-containing protein [Thermoanaerobaculia bacterium]